MNEPELEKDTLEQVLKFKVAPIIHSDYKDTSSVIDQIQNENFRELMDIPENENLREYYREELAPKKELLGKLIEGFEAV